MRPLRNRAAIAVANVLLLAGLCAFVVLLVIATFGPVR